nr:nifU-like protein 1, chloroplastic [Ipomoea batatas]
MMNKVRKLHADCCEMMWKEWFPILFSILARPITDHGHCVVGPGPAVAVEDAGGVLLELHGSDGDSDGDGLVGHGLKQGGFALLNFIKTGDACHWGALTVATHALRALPILFSILARPITDHGHRVVGPSPAVAVEHAGGVLLELHRPDGDSDGDGLVCHGLKQGGFTLLNFIKTGDACHWGALTVATHALRALGVEQNRMPNVFLSSQFASTTAGAQHHSHQKKFDSTAMVVPMQGTEKYVIFQSLNSSDHKQCSLVIGRDARAVYNGGLYSSDQFDLTPENVDKVLEDVLPYLIADSGNVDAKCLSRTMPFLSSFKILSYPILFSFLARPITHHGHCVVEPAPALAVEDAGGIVLECHPADGDSDGDGLVGHGLKQGGFALLHFIKSGDACHGGALIVATHALRTLVWVFRFGYKAADFLYRLEGLGDHAPIAAVASLVAIQKLLFRQGN